MGAGSTAVTGRVPRSLDLGEALDVVMTWMDHLAATGGPDFLPISARKLESERVEFIEGPSLHEAADVLICLTAACADAGFSAHDMAFGLLAAVGADKKLVAGLRTRVQIARNSWRVPVMDEAARACWDLVSENPTAYWITTLSVPRGGYPSRVGLVESSEIFAGLIAQCHYHGWTVADLAAAVVDKHQINLARRWVPLPDGTYRHAETAQQPQTGVRA